MRCAERQAPPSVKTHPSEKREGRGGVGDSERSLQRLVKSMQRVSEAIKASTFTADTVSIVLDFWSSRQMIEMKCPSVRESRWTNDFPCCLLGLHDNSILFAKKEKKKNKWPCCFVWSWIKLTTAANLYLGWLTELKRYAKHTHTHTHQVFCISVKLPNLVDVACMLLCVFVHVWLGVPGVCDRTSNRTYWIDGP